MAVLAGSLLAGCGSGDPVVDGWPIGPEAGCSDAARCPEKLAAATIGLDRRDPGHPAVVTVTLHDEGRMVDSFGNSLLPIRSGACCSVARFTLADGTVNAIGVGTVGVAPTLHTVDYGP